MGSGERNQWKSTDGLGQQVAHVRKWLKQRILPAGFTLASSPVDYPARGTDILVPRGSDLVGGLGAYGRRIKSYFDGLSEGVGEAKAYLQARQAACPDEVIVLAGYSQGAMVMHRLLLKLDDGVAKRVAAVVLIADGDRRPNARGKVIGSPAAGAGGQGIAQAFGNQDEIPKRHGPSTWHFLLQE